MTALMLQNQIEQFHDLLSTRLGEDRVTWTAQLVKLRDEVKELGDVLDEYLAGQVREEDVIKELADVIIICTMMARTLDVRATILFKSVTDKMRINLSRAWYPTASGTARHTTEVLT